MAQKRKNKSKKWIFWVILLVIFVVAGVCAYLIGRIFFQDKAGMLDPKAMNAEQGEVEEVESSNTEENTNESEAETPAEPDKKVTQYEGTDPNTLNELTGTITQAEKDGNMLIVRNNIDQYLSGGACELTLMRGDTVLDKFSGRIIPVASTSTCEGFDIPADDYGSGMVQIKIKMSSGGKTGTIEGEAKL